ncbi:hypothetical protein C8R45DRAFT_1111949 [Mycena sanguinolenta]|nr:hypothetical protein C8R45DRAFT_1111949 [Mycena sanguinolenta]
MEAWGSAQTRIERLVSCPPHASSATLRIRSSALSSTSTSSLLRKRTSYRARASSGRRSASFPHVLCVSSHQALESSRHNTTASPPSRPEPSRTTDLGHRLPRDSAHTSQVGGARLSFGLHPKPKTLSTPLSAKPDDNTPIMHSFVGALERHSHTAADCAPPHHPHHTQSTPSRHALIDRRHEALRHVYMGLLALSLSVARQHRRHVHPAPAPAATTTGRDVSPQIVDHRSRGCAALHPRARIYIGVHIGVRVRTALHPPLDAQRSTRRLQGTKQVRGAPLSQRRREAMRRRRSPPSLASTPHPAATPRRRSPVPSSSSIPESQPQPEPVLEPDP